MLETSKWEYTFATDVFKKLGSLVQVPIRLKFVTLHTISDCLGRLATMSERIG